MAKLNVSTLRKLRKELKNRANRIRYSKEHSFQSKDAAALITKRYTKDINAIKKLRIGDVFNVFFSDYGPALRFEQHSPRNDKVVIVDEAMLKDFEIEKKRFEASSKVVKLDKLAEKLGNIEVDCLVGSLATDDPVIEKLLEEVRVALKS